MVHKPVLVKEVLQYLDPRPGENFIDATVGQSGHALALLKNNGPGGQVLGIDLDIEQIKNSQYLTADVSERMILINDSYVNLKEIIEKNKFRPLSGILLDLGYSSWHLEQSQRGFSFKRDDLLDMRYDIKNTLTAEKIVNEYPETEIEKILKNFGEEIFASEIARKIKEHRKFKRIKSTSELRKIIEEAIPKRFQKGRIHCATRSFQAIRIAVNEELDNLKKFLPQALEVLPKDGKLAIISFHSLEDRLIKNFFKLKEEEGVLEILTKKPLTPSKMELAANQRSRSAKLRVAVKK